MKLFSYFFKLILINTPHYQTSRLHVIKVYASLYLTLTQRMPVIGIFPFIYTLKLSGDQFCCLSVKTALIHLNAKQLGFRLTSYQDHYLLALDQGHYH